MARRMEGELDAHEDLEQRRNNDVSVAEAVVASKYKDMAKEMKSRYDVRLAAKLTEKEKHPRRWMEEVGRNRPPRSEGRRTRTERSKTRQCGKVLGVCKKQENQIFFYFKNFLCVLILCVNLSMPLFMSWQVITSS
jgi:hypothetical protein